MPWTVVVWLALMVISALMTKSPKTVSQKPGEFDATTVDSSSPVPVLFGTRLMSNPNLVWYGDVRTKAIKTKGGKK